ncbi:MAG: hypothetical protein ACOY3Z_09815 [Thermodesulfobacteriota bacterium]
MKIYSLAGVITIALVMTGCANLNSVHREIKVSEGSGALVDIKQRAIFASKDTKAPYGTIVCAEPSPDALSAYAAEIAAKADVPNKASVAISSAFQESSSFTGLRTQTIQLLRDSRYRDCEAYMNGALDGPQYDLQARRHQKLTIALMAIEQLTGVVRAPSATINTNGSAEAAKSIAELRIEMGEVDKAIVFLQKKKDDEATTDDEKKAIDDRIKQLQGDKDAIAKGIETARGTLVSGTATSSISNVAVPTQKSDKHIEAVTKAVENIVQSVLDTSDLGQMCFMHMQRPTEKLSEAGKQLQATCVEYFKLDQAAAKLQLDSMQESLSQLKTGKADSSKKAEDAKKLAEQLDKLRDKTKLLTVKPPQQ